MAVRKKERERRKGLEYRTADSYLVARRCAAYQLQAPPMGEGMCVKEMEGDEEEEEVEEETAGYLSCPFCHTVQPVLFVLFAALGPAAKGGRQARLWLRGGFYFVRGGR